MFHIKALQKGVHYGFHYISYIPNKWQYENEWLTEFWIEIQFSSSTLYHYFSLASFLNLSLFSELVAGSTTFSGKDVSWNQLLSESTFPEKTFVRKPEHFPEKELKIDKRIKNKMKHAILIKSFTIFLKSKNFFINSKIAILIFFLKASNDKL